jgi:hypothetical protein
VRFLKNNDSVGIGTSPIVAHPPDVGGLGKSLLVDQYPRTAKTGFEAYGNNNFIKPQVSLTNLTNFKRNNTLRTHDPMEFKKDPLHCQNPRSNGTNNRQPLFDIFEVYVIEPASQPIVLSVVHGIQKWG